MSKLIQAAIEGNISKVCDELSTSDINGTDQVVKTNFNKLLWIPMIWFWSTDFLNHRMRWIHVFINIFTEIYLCLITPGCHIVTLMRSHVSLSLATLLCTCFHFMVFVTIPLFARVTIQTIPLFASCLLPLLLFAVALFFVSLYLISTLLYSTCIMSSSSSSPCYCCSTETLP